jgi:hypothetical protein
MPPRARNVKAAEDALKDFNVDNVKVSDKTFDEKEPDSSAPFTKLDPELPPTSKRTTKIAKELANMYTMVGTTVYMVNPRIGVTIINKADDCASALDDLARTNPRVRRALERMLTTSAYSAVITAHLPIVVAVATEYVPFIRDAYEQSFSGPADADDGNNDGTVHPFPNGASYA